MVVVVVLVIKEQLASEAGRDHREEGGGVDDHAASGGGGGGSVVPLGVMVQPEVDVGLHQPDWPPADDHPPNVGARLPDDGLDARVHVLAAAEVDVRELGQLGRVEELPEGLGGDVVGVVEEQLFEALQFGEALEAERGDVLRMADTQFP